MNEMVIMEFDSDFHRGECPKCGTTPLNLTLDGPEPDSNKPGEYPYPHKMLCPKCKFAFLAEWVDMNDEEEDDG